ncbi:MAG: cytochrome-c oxidase, cbb3-type subunit III [Oceanospirillum sp.]|nr:cytochrome-c oxidase, cbb3-type subunit III [Oceanospirillum sp.]MDX1397076.1 cytochrome-c oxidase, cbb3-type subunit III [Oceanospirillum sp.]
MTSFWSAWIIVITLGVIAGCWWVLFANRVSAPKSGDVKTMGHSFDGIEEYDNPMPRWWFIMFIATIIFSLVYLALYPGLGTFKGFLGWTQVNQWEAEIQYADEHYAPIFDQYATIPVADLAQDEEAMKVGQRLYANNCSLCHGSDGRGAYGFPNLTDNDWLYGGSADAIKHTIVNGRNGQMPAWGEVLGDEGVTQMTQYVLSLSGQETDAAAAQTGAATYTAMCAACHGADGKGNQMLGAPNLTDNTWLYLNPEWGVAKSVEQSIRLGRNGHMPAQAKYIGEDKVHLVAAYVYSLSQGK